MTDVTFETAQPAATVASGALEALRSGLRGPLCFPGDAGYEQARAVWNQMIDRRPALVVRAEGAADVMRVVSLARAQRIPLAVRAGGHGIAGNAIVEGGLVLDLSLMKSVRVDPARRTARVEPGVTLGEFDKEAQSFGLATPLGINSTTGVSGLTLGGGFGWLTRKLGLTVDNLLSADVVLAKGALVHASEDENPDLFWAIRGGGGNFGAVTSFEFQLHPLGPQVFAGLVVHPVAHPVFGAKRLLQEYRRIVAAAPEELACWVVMRRAPPLPFLPREFHGEVALIFALCYAGDLEEGERAAAPVRALGEPVADAVQAMPFVAWQSIFDPLLGPGARNYWKSHNFTELSDGAIDVLLDQVGRLPSPECELFIGNLGGAANRVPPDATAYPHRAVQFVLNAHTRWRDPAQDRPCIAWARELFDRLAPFATGGVYVNFMPEDERQRVRQGAYGSNYSRLAMLKARYDPENLFRFNQNIAPAQ